MHKIPDPAVDFEGCVYALARKAIRETAGMTEEEAAEHHLMRSIEHAVRMHELDAPQFLIDLANRGMHRHLRKLRDTARSSKGSPGAA